MILHNIEKLKPEPNAFSFDQPTNLIILEVGGLEGHDAKASFSSNIHNLAIINSTIIMLNNNPNLFSRELRLFQFHLVGSVLASGGPDLDQGYTFNFESSQLARLVIEGCSVTSTHKRTFIKATAASVEVLKEKLVRGKGPTSNS